MLQFKRMYKELRSLPTRVGMWSILNICMICFKKKTLRHIRIYGGGGGVIIPREIKELHDYGIARIFSPDDGRIRGLQGMINMMLEECDFPTITDSTLEEVDTLATGDVRAIAKLISLAENAVGEEMDASTSEIFTKIKAKAGKAPVLGITGTGGAGKSSLTDELIRRFINEIPEKKIAILSVDPTKQKTGGRIAW